MATDTVVHIGQPSMTVAELVAFTKKELDADAERQAKLQAAGAGEVPRESQTGATLDLSHKNIHALPVEVIVLIKDKVERLALSHNPQISIPSQIVQCDRIRYLNIRWNQLSQFPGAILQLSKLEILDLSKNRIVSIPEDINRLTSLKFLAVARNRITRLPLAIGDMSSLSKLKFDENPIEFPPPEALRASQEPTSSSSETQTSHDVCQRVKRFLRATANKERLRTSEDESSESNVETPRPPRRPFTGRFPIRPSISGIENASDPRSDSPSDHVPPPIPLRSHARVASSTATNTLLHVKRPGIAPLLVNGNDINRSRSETAPSSASLRSRRQGFVPTRRVTENLNPVSETASQASSRLSQASTVKPAHSRGTSSLSTVNSFLAASSGEGSSDAISPVHGPGVRFDEMHGLSSPPRNRKRPESTDTVKGSKRLFALYQLQRPINEVAAAIKDGTPKRSVLERQAFTANAQVEELDRLLRRLQNGMDDGITKNLDAMKAIVRTSVQALKSYGSVTTELKRNTSKLVRFADGVYVRCLMFQIFSTMVEARNICTVLGFKLKDRPVKETPRISQAWSSKSVTPTQPKPPTSRRMRGATPLQSMASNATIRMMPPPPVPLNTNGARSNTMTSIGAATPRSGESFSTTASRDPALSRTNTMRSVMDLGDNDEQFDRIFLKLKAACDLAAQALPHCRLEFNTRRENAQNTGQRTLAHHWSMALKKCEIVMTHNKTLKKRLEVVKVNDPGIRFQRDFWQLCDAFVHSWADLATEVKDIASQRVDITTVRQVMRNVQRAVKDVSKTISHSPLYHHAIGTKGPDSAGPQSLAPPFPAGLPTTYPAQTGQMGAQSSYVAGPATPLSAAIGPAAHSSIAPTPSTTQQGEYFPPPQTASRSTHERNDTVMQPPRPSRRQ